MKSLRFIFIIFLKITTGSHRSSHFQMSLKLCFLITFFRFLFFNLCTPNNFNRFQP